MDYCVTIILATTTNDHTLSKEKFYDLGSLQKYYFARDDSPLNFNDFIHMIMCKKYNSDGHKLCNMSETITTKYRGYYDKMRTGLDTMSNVNNFIKFAELYNKHYHDKYITKLNTQIISFNFELFDT